MTSPDRPATLGQLRDTGYATRTVKQEIRANLLDRLRSGEPAFPGIVGFDDTVLPELETRAARRARPGAARRARPGQDPADAHPGGAARRVEPRRRRLRDQRRPAGPRVRALPAAAGRGRRRAAGHLAAPHRALHREAGHPRHQRRRPRRRRRPGQGRPGPDPGRPRDGALRPGAAHQPRRVRAQRAARPRRADPGRDVQRAGGARHPDPRLLPAAAAGPAAGGHGQPRGLHQPRPDHHAAEGPLRRRDPHPLPARGR